jgi:oxygen-dependent protoporphyrinogen oxidase
MQVEVAIVGGGIAGLACAWELVAAGQHDVLLLEAAPRCGGPIESVRKDAWLLERGPCTVRATPELERLFRRAGLETVEGRRAGPLVVSDGKLVALPPRLTDLLRGTWLPRSALLSILAEPLRAPRAGPRSVRDLMAERFGAEVALRAADIVTLGTFGASAERVGFESAFPQLADALADARGRFAWLALRRLLHRSASSSRAPLVSTPEGLGPLPERLARGLGDRVRTSAPVRRIALRPGGFELAYGAEGEHALAARRVVLALPPARLAGVLDLPQIGALLESFSSTPQTVAQFALEDRSCAERWTGLGFLAPSREHLPLLGCLFPSNLFAGRAPAGTLLASVFVGPALRAASEVALVRDLGPVLKRLLGTGREPLLLDVARHPAGIPLYDLEHRERVRSLRALLASTPGLFAAGWGYDGIGLGAAASSGVRAARAALETR